MAVHPGWPDSERRSVSAPLGGRQPRLGPASWTPTRLGVLPATRRPGRRSAAATCHHGPLDLCHADPWDRLGDPVLLGARFMTTVSDDSTAPTPHPGEQTRPFWEH